MSDFIELSSIEDIDTTGKTALLFHIPGHCAGCKRVKDSLSKRPCDGWKIYLVDAENDNNKPLIEKYQVSTAPTIVLYNDEEMTGTIVGLKDFLQKADELFGTLNL